MKLLIATTGPHMYLDMTHFGQQAEAFRPSVVENSPYIQTLLASQKVKILCASLKEEATDAEFAKYVAESAPDMDLAVTSFCQAFNPVEEVKDQTPPKAAEPKAEKKA